MECVIQRPAMHPNKTMWMDLVQPDAAYRKQFATMRHLSSTKQKPVWWARCTATNKKVVVKHVQSQHEWAAHLAVQYTGNTQSHFHPGITPLYAVYSLETDGQSAVAGAGVEVEGVMYTSGYLLVMECAESDLTVRFLQEQNRGNQPATTWDFKALLKACVESIEQVHNYSKTWTQEERAETVRAGSILSLLVDAGSPLPNLAHNDVKPDNFFVTGNEQGKGPTTVRLGDFGCAAIQGSVTAGVTLCYGAPEQLAGSSSGTSDWFCLSAMLYAMLAGRHYRALPVHSISQLTPRQRSDVIRGRWAARTADVQRAFAAHYRRPTRDVLVQCLCVKAEDRPSLSTTHRALRAMS
eukprot:m.19014 g.19014  ORF g.19014 m.19014 type:complete len:352 (-) comp7968_c0_seq2:2446-3501(-)